jgi:flagellin
MRELSVQSGNSTLNSSDRSQIQGELDQLAAEIDAIAQKTNFNRVNLLDGSNDKLTIQMGIDATDKLDIQLKKNNRRKFRYWKFFHICNTSDYIWKNNSFS